MTRLPVDLRLLRWLVRRWPLPRGRRRVEQLASSLVRSWPARADIDFAYGRMLDVSLRPWPLGYRELFVRGTLDEEDLAIWGALLRPGDVVVDGGANLGYWCMAASHLVGNEGNVFGFEPVPATAAQLRRNLAASACSNVAVIEVALSDQDGEITLNLAADDGAGTLASIGRHEWCGWEGELQCPAMRLDRFCEDHGVRPQLIKLDLEGAERPALLGAQGLFQGGERPAIAFEWNPVTASAAGYHPAESLALLEAVGYRAYLAGREGLIRFDARGRPADWFPTVWCMAEGEMQERLRRRGRIDGS